MAANSQLPLPVTAEKHENGITATFLGLGDSAGKLLERVKAFSTSSTESKPATTPDGATIDEEPATPSVSFKITEEEVLERVNAFRRFRQPHIAQDIEVTDLPVFESITPYEGDIEVQSKLWAKEVARLVKAVNDDQPLEFRGSDDLAVDSRASHQLLAKLSDIVFQAFQVVLFDNQCILAEHVQPLCDSDILERSRTSLYYLCNRDDEDGDADDDPKMLIKHRRDIFAFIDICVAVLARVLCGVAEKKSLAIETLALLATVTTKLKVVSANLREFAQVSLDNGTLIKGDDQGGRGGGPREQTAQAQAGGAAGARAAHDMAANLTVDRGGLGLETQLGQWNFTTSKKDALRLLYLEQCRNMRAGVLEILLHMLLKVRGNNTLMSRSFTRYEICAMVYETGFERFRTFVFQDPNTHFTGTAHPYSISCATQALHIINAVVGHLRDQEAVSGTTEVRSIGIDSADSDKASIGTRITSSYSLEKEETANLAPDSALDAGIKSSARHRAPIKVDLKTMNNVISVLVPLLFTHPVISFQVGSFLATMTTDPSRDTEPVRARPGHRVSAYFCLDTEECRAAQQSCGPKDARSLSNSLIRRGGLLAGEKIAQIGRVGTFPSLASPKTSAPLSTTSMPTPTKARLDLEGSYSDERIRKHRRELDTASSKMQAWVLEEKGVTVQCKFYVSSVMLTCALLVAGGIGVGISVGDRIVGVDPFNITTYCWVLAAFVVLVAKSVRVHEWPWNDFLYGRVLCRSVSELSSVTGIHEQLIMAYLLQTETTSFLTTRGPFNSVFRRRSDDGFSIDRPLSLWTLLISGILMIEVDSIFGRGLVGLDLRRGQVLGAVPDTSEVPSGIIDSKDGSLICLRLQDQAVNPRTGYLQVRLERGSMSRYKAIGFYGNDKAVFV
ncbi:hypothetical protein QBC39DRAFT_347839 [Podospora conica]|nr:hypothetical protein QBC39DRAFT_347839 [Schizothecium conicum]